MLMPPAPLDRTLRPCKAVSVLNRFQPGECPEGRSLPSRTWASVRSCTLSTGRAWKASVAIEMQNCLLKTHRLEVCAWLLQA